MRRLAGVIAITMMVAGCERAQPTSAGVPSWMLVEDQRIGSVEDDARGFTEIRGILVTRDRRVLVSDGWTDLRVIDSSGRFLRAIGGAGAGPGEFERVDGFGLLGDTIWGFDEQRERITLFGRDGSPLAAFPMRAPALPDAPAPGRPWTMISSGSIVASYALRLPPDCKVGARMLVRLQRAADSVRKPPASGGTCSTPATSSEPTFVVRDTLARHAIRDYQVSSTPLKSYPGRTTPLHVLFSQPLADHTLWHPAHDGMTIVLVKRTAATSADSASFSVTKLVYGDTTIARHYQYTPAPVPDALIDSILANTEEGRYGMAREAVYHPRYRPPVTDAVVGTDGSVWLKREFSYGPTHRWTVIHPSGEIVGEVNVPSSHELRAADAEYVWTTFTDDDDVPFIVRHRIVKTGSPP